MIPGMCKITDIIYLNHEQDAALIDLWERSAISKRTDMGMPIPSDLFFAKTIPLHNFMVQLDEMDESGSGDMVYAFFFLMDEELNGIPMKIEFPEGLTYINYVMNILFTHGNDPSMICARIATQDGNDRLFAFEVCAFNEKKKSKRFTREEMERYNLSQWLGAFLETWYGIEIAMLHPTVKEVFVHPKVKKEKISKKDRAEYGHKVYRYVKHHYTTDDELNDAIYGKESHPFNRKALIWYVSGHWREYKTGKKVFIQPYWKGALRATKKAEPRNREIVIEKEVTT